MKKTSDYAKKLKKLISELRADYEAPEHESLPPLPTLVFAFLAEDASTAAAEEAYERLMIDMIDFNDLRVTDRMDIVEKIGKSYPFVVKRTLAMTTTLLSIYDKEYGTKLDHLDDMTKRDARTYLEKLDGITPFVVGSVMSLSLGAHAVPTDQQLVNVLRAHDVIDPEADLEEVNSFLEQNIKAAESTEVHYLFRGFVDDAEKDAKRTGESALIAASKEKVDKLDLLGKSKATTKKSSSSSKRSKSKKKKTSKKKSKKSKK